MPGAGGQGQTCRFSRLIGEFALHRRFATALKSFSTSIAALQLASVFLAQSVAAQQTPEVRETQAGPIAQQSPGAMQAQMQVDPLVFAVPGAQQTPAPDWLRPGTRLTFYASSSVRNSDSGKPGIRPDPNGDIIDSNGNRWSLTDPDGVGHGQAGSSGGIGWSIVDVIASEPGVLVLQQVDYLLPKGFNNPARQTATAPIISHPSGCKFVLHPRLLAQVPSVHQPDITIFQQGYRHNDRDFNSLRVVATSAGYEMEVYDLASGVLLAAGYRVSGSKGHVVDQHGTIHTSSGTTQANLRFVSSRELPLPWLAQPMQMPAWARQMKRMRYQGHSQLKFQNNHGMGDLPATPVSAEITTKQVGSNWSLYETSYAEHRNDGLPVIPATGQQASGPGSLMGVWMDPAALKNLRTGQVLDHDQVTGQQTIVEFAGAGQDGRPVVAITSSTAIQKLTNVYDASDGRIVQMMRVDSFPDVQSQTIITLTLVAME